MCKRVVILYLVIVAAMMAAQPTLASASPEWARGLFQRAGINGNVTASAKYDDGSGSALYIAGDFDSTGDVQANHIAKWNGESWSALGSGLNGPVYAMLVYDDGSGTALYVGGEFSTAGGVAAANIAKWNGSSWSALDIGTDGSVASLALFYDGASWALYAGGFFKNAGGVLCNGVAKWNGAIWSDLAGGTNGSVTALAVHNDGSGAALYAGGAFSAGGTTTVTNIAKWNGTAWSSVGLGLNNAVHALTVFNNGTGDALYAGGLFDKSGATAMNYIARWNGTAWSAVGSGPGGGVYALLPFGADLYAAGEFAGKGVTKWNGTAWSSSSPNARGLAFSLATFNDGSGNALFVGGSFGQVGDLNASYIARYNGSSWAKLGDGMDGEIYALDQVNTSSGPLLLASGCGTDEMLNLDPKTGLSSFCGSFQQPFGVPHVAATAWFDDGTGPALYVAGRFISVAGVAASNIAKWNGTSWSALGTGLNDDVNALVVHNDGAGPALYAGGFFTVAGGVTVTHAAKWNGTDWSAMGSLSPEAFALASYDDGAGSELYAAGWFSLPGSTTMNCVAKWNGSSWISLGAGLDAEAYALKVLDDGTGSALYVGGRFLTAGGLVANRVAKWKNGAWSTLGGGFDDFDVRGLAVADDGSGPALYAGGGFYNAGGADVHGMAKWDGASWASVGGGVGVVTSVCALASFNDGAGQALFAGGAFTTAGNNVSVNLARWGSEQVAADCMSAKFARDSRLVSFSGAVSTAVFGDAFYLEQDNRAAGIRVQKKGHGMGVNRRVAVAGRMSTNMNGERFISAWSAGDAGAAEVAPLGLPNFYLGGGSASGQQGIAGSAGLNNIGLLVTTWGMVMDVSGNTFTIDDGSGIPVKCIAPGSVSLVVGNYVSVTGISSCHKIGTDLQHVLLVRSVLNDIVAF